MRVPPHGKLLPQQDQIGDESWLATLKVPGSGRMRQMIAAVPLGNGTKSGLQYRCVSLSGNYIIEVAEHLLFLQSAAAAVGILTI